MGPYVTQDTITAKGKKWLKHVAPFNTHPMQLNRDKAALLIIDMQRFFWILLPPHLRAAASQFSQS